MPAGVLWYSSTDATEALDATTVLVDGSVYYAGPVEGICDDRPSVTVTLSDSPAVPTVTPFTQCDVDGATIADLDITGEADATFTVYSDETLATEVGSTEELTEGTYYVTQTNVAGCVSDAASLTVSFSNSDAPVLVSNAECIPIDGTLADLEEIVSANGDITWYATATSTDPLSRMTTLTDGTIYYATSTNDEGCESATRLAVTADFCPIVIPEIFTPNGDGINDYFAITGISAEYPNHMLEIYNRWGEPVYVGKGENPGWDGTSTEGSIGSGVLPVGVYFYILYYNDGQTAPTQGKLYLSR
jgi:gliding motility-associated-like protein